MRPQVTLYTKGYCPFCHSAKMLLNDLGVKFTEHDITNDRQRREEMIKFAEGRTTVPQIFINDIPIGGASDLFTLNRSGGLNSMLAPQHAAKT